MPAHEKFVSGIFGAIKCLYRGKKTKGEGEGRRMVDWERGGGWWTGHTGSGMKETQRGGRTRTSRPMGDALVSC
jgi:hypothetical protein